MMDRETKIAIQKLQEQIRKLEKIVPNLPTRYPRGSAGTSNAVLWLPYTGP